MVFTSTYLYFDPVSHSVLRLQMGSTTLKKVSIYYTLQYITPIMIDSWWRSLYNIGNFWYLWIGKIATTEVSVPKVTKSILFMNKKLTKVEINKSSTLTLLSIIVGLYFVVCLEYHKFTACIFAALSKITRVHRVSNSIYFILVSIDLYCCVSHQLWFNGKRYCCGWTTHAYILFSTESANHWIRNHL